MFEKYIKIKIKYLPRILEIGWILLYVVIAVPALSQKTAEKEQGVLRTVDGQKLPVLIFDDDIKRLSGRVVVDSKKGKQIYTPDKLQGFEIGDEKNGLEIYESLNFKGKDYFFQKMGSGFYHYYYLKRRKEKGIYFLSSDQIGAELELTALKNGQTLKFFADKFEVPFDQGRKLNAKNIADVINAISEKEGVLYQHHQRKKGLYVGAQYLQVNENRIFELNFTRRNLFNAKFLEWQSKLILADGPFQSYLAGTGINFKFWRGWFQPYFYFGSGVGYNTNEKARRQILPILFVVPGFDFRINRNNYIKAELLFFYPSIGYMRRLR